MLVDSLGSVTAQFSFDAFGELYAQSGTSDTNYLYTGQWYDSLTGLYNLRARQYDAGLGRFLSRDRWAYNYRNPFELNRYGYVGGNPINGYDPSGYFTEYMVKTFNSVRTTAVKYLGEKLSTCLASVVIGVAVGATMSAGISAILQTQDGQPGIQGDAVKRAAVSGAVQGGAGSLFGCVPGMNRWFTEWAADTAIGTAWDVIVEKENIFFALFMNASLGLLITGASNGIEAGVRNAFKYLDDVKRAVNAPSSGSVTPNTDAPSQGSTTPDEMGAPNTSPDGDRSPIGAACSFSEDTPVSTADGFTLIGELRLNDYVWAYNEETGEVELHRVIAIWSHLDDVLLLTIDGEVIETTANHPFYTSDGEWVAAGDLEIGDLIQNAAGEFGTVTAVTLIDHEQAMYNLTVDVAHTYFVGVGGWLVHNDGCNVNVPIEKFTEYIFKPDATHGKANVFHSLGYDIEDSILLKQMYEEQALSAYLSGEYELGKLDQYGQRINIEIKLQDRGHASNEVSYLRSGWMIRDDGITLNTPFSGFTR